MESLLIYTTVGKSHEYLKCLDYFCASLVFSNRAKMNLLVICDTSFQPEVKTILSQYAFLNTYTFPMADSDTPEKASMHKTHIFDFPEVSNFPFVLYVDLDCIFVNSLSFLFKDKIEDNKLYVFVDRHNTEDNNEKWFCLERPNKPGLIYYTPTQWDFITKHNQYPFNGGLFLFRSSPIMRRHFDALNKLISGYTGNFFYEQSFMNTYFHLNLTCEYNKLNQDNILMLINDKDISDFKMHHNIIHFVKTKSGSKYTDMKLFFERFYTSKTPRISKFFSLDGIVESILPSAKKIVYLGNYVESLITLLLNTVPDNIDILVPPTPQLLERYIFYPNVSIKNTVKIHDEYPDSSIDCAIIDIHDETLDDIIKIVPKIKKGGLLIVSNKSSNTNIDKKLCCSHNISIIAETRDRLHFVLFVGLLP